MGCPRTPSLRLRTARKGILGRFRRRFRLTGLASNLGVGGSNPSRRASFPRRSAHFRSCFVGHSLGDTRWVSMGCHETERFHRVPAVERCQLPWLFRPASCRASISRCRGAGRSTKSQSARWSSIDSTRRSAPSVLDVSPGGRAHLERRFVRPFLANAIPDAQTWMAHHAWHVLAAGSNAAATVSARADSAMGSRLYAASLVATAYPSRDSRSTSPLAGGKNPEHGSLRCDRLELLERRILVYRNVRPCSRRAVQVGLQHRRSALHGKLFEPDLLGPPVA